MMEGYTPEFDDTQETIKSNNNSPAPVLNGSFSSTLPLPFVPSIYDRHPEAVNERLRYQKANGEDNEQNATVESRYGIVPYDPTDPYYSEELDRHEYTHFDQDYAYYGDQMNDNNYHKTASPRLTPVSNAKSRTSATATPPFPQRSALDEKVAMLQALKEKLRQLEEEKQKRKQTLPTAPTSTSATTTPSPADKSVSPSTEAAAIELLEAGTVKLETKVEMIEQDVETAEKQGEQLHKQKQDSFQGMDVIVIDSDSDGEAMEVDILPSEPPAPTPTPTPTPAVVPHEQLQEQESTTQKATPHFAEYTCRELDLFMEVTNEKIERAALGLCEKPSLEHPVLQVPEITAPDEEMQETVVNTSLPEVTDLKKDAGGGETGVSEEKDKSGSSSRPSPPPLSTEEEKEDDDEEEKEDVDNVEDEDEDMYMSDEDDDEELEQQASEIASLKESLENLNAYIRGLKLNLNRINQEEKKRNLEILNLQVKLSIMKNADVLEAGELKETKNQQQQQSMKRGLSFIDGIGGNAKRKRSGDDGGYRNVDDDAALGNSSLKRPNRQPYAPTVSDSNEYYNNLHDRPSYSNYYNQYPAGSSSRIPIDLSNTFIHTPDQRPKHPRPDNAANTLEQKSAVQHQSAFTTSAPPPATKATTSVDNLPSTTSLSATTTAPTPLTLSERLKSLMATSANSTASQSPSFANKEDMTTKISNTLLQAEQEIRQALNDYNNESSSHQQQLSATPIIQRVIATDQYAVTIGQYLGASKTPSAVDEQQQHHQQQNWDDDVAQTSPFNISVIQLHPSISTLFENFKQPFILYSPLFSLLKRLYINNKEEQLQHQHHASTTSSYKKPLDTFYRTITNYIPNDFDWTALFMSRYLLNVPLQYPQLNAMYQNVCAWASDYPKIELLAALQLELAIYADPVKCLPSSATSPNMKMTHETLVQRDFKAGMDAFPCSVDVFWQYLMYRRGNKNELMQTLKAFLRSMAETKANDQQFVSRSTVELLTRLVFVGYVSEALEILTNGKYSNICTTRMEILPLDTSLYIHDKDKFHLWMVIVYYLVMKDVPYTVCEYWMQHFISTGKPSLEKPIFIVDYSKVFPLNKATLIACLNVYFSMLSYYGRLVIRNGPEPRRLFYCVLKALLMLLTSAKLNSKEHLTTEEQKKLLLSVEKSIQLMDPSIAVDIELDFDIKMRLMLLGNSNSDESVHNVNATVIESFADAMDKIADRDTAFSFAHQAACLYAQHFHIRFDSIDTLYTGISSNNGGDGNGLLPVSLFETNRLLVLVYILSLPVFRLTSLKMMELNDEEINRLLFVTQQYLTEGTQRRTQTTTMTEQQVQEQKRRVLLTAQAAYRAYKRYLGITTVNTTSTPLSASLTQSVANRQAELDKLFSENKRNLFLWINLFILRKVCHLLFVDLNGSSAVQTLINSSDGNSSGSSVAGTNSHSENSSGFRGEWSMEEVKTTFDVAKVYFSARICDNGASATTATTAATEDNDSQRASAEFAILSKYVQALFNL